MAGNKHDNGVHEVGTPETLKAYQEDTPYQNVEKYLAGIQEVIQEKKDKQKKSFMQVFQNPLKGFPYNEELDDNFVKPLKESGDDEEEEIPAPTPTPEPEDVEAQTAVVEGKMSDLLIDIQQGATAKELAKEWPITLQQAKEFLKDYYSQKKGPRKEEVEETEEAFSDKQKSGKEIAKKMLKIKSLKGSKYIKQISQMKKISAAELDKILPDYVSGGDIGGLFEAKKLKNLIPEFEKIVKTKGAAKVSGVMVDMFTASVIVKAYAKVNDKNKKRMETSDVYTLIKIAQKMMGLKEDQVNEGKSLAQLKSKYKKAVKNYNNNRDIGDEAAMAFAFWAIKNGEIRTDNPDEFDQWLDDNLSEESINESNWGFVFYNKKSLDNFLKDPYIKSVTKNVTIDQEKFRGGKSGFSVGIESDEDLGLNPLAKKVEKIKKKYGKPGVDYAHVEHDGESISEGTWALPKTSKQKKELKDLLKKPVILGKEGDDAADKLYDLIGDDGLFDDLYTAGKKNPKGDARPIIKAKMKELGIKEGKMDGNKLTGQEISVYFRRNKVRDKTVRKAVEIALDHGGAMTYAVKQIEKLKRGLSKDKDVQKALNYANFGEQIRLPEVGFMFKEDSPVAGDIKVEGDQYIPQKKGVNKNIANYWNKEIKGLKPKELEAIQSMYMITDHSGVVAMYKAGKRDFIKSIKS